MHMLRLPLAALLFAAGPALAQLPAGIDDGGLYFRTPAARFAPATRLSTEFDLDVTGIVARVTVRQRFLNTGDEWVEGIYVFPLPDDAAVNRLTMEIGNRRIEGEISEREEARRTYERARAAGQQASLVEQERPNLFTTSVANIGPGQEISIEIGYLQTAAFDDGTFELRVPMTLTPRFIPEGVADASRISPPVRSPAEPDTHRAAVEIVIDAGMPLAEAQSTSHTLTSSWDGRAYRLATGGRDVPMDRDLIVSWQVVPGQSPGVAAFTETVAGESHVLLMFLPPATAAMPDPTPRELVFVVDTSGSMGGSSIEQAKAALATALERLTPSDRFNVVEFNDQAYPLFPGSVAATRQALDDARRFVASLRSNGGTNIASALELSLGQPAAQGYLRQIVFITDGSVGNESSLFGMIRDGLGEARLFTVGIGSAPNTHFMRKAARFGRGGYSHIARAAEVEPAMTALFTKLEHAALTDIEIDWPAAFEVYPERVPDLYRGEPVVVAARTAGAITGRLAVDVKGRSGPYGWSERIDVSADDAPGVASIWARRKIESLLDSRLEGASEDAVRRGVVDVAVAHGLVSPYTSLVAVDRTPERTRSAALRREALGNLAPAGSDPGALLAGFPGTATDAAWYQLIGTVLTTLCLGLFGIARLRRKLDA